MSVMSAAVITSSSAFAAMILLKIGAAELDLIASMWQT